MLNAVINQFIVQRGLPNCCQFVCTCTICSHWESRHFIPQSVIYYCIGTSKMGKDLLTAMFMYWITVWKINYPDTLSEQCVVDSLRQQLFLPQCCLLHISAHPFYFMNRTVFAVTFENVFQLQHTYMYLMQEFDIGLQGNELTR